MNLKHLVITMQTTTRLLLILTFLAGALSGALARGALTPPSPPPASAPLPAEPLPAAEAPPLVGQVSATAAPVPAPPADTEIEPAASTPALAEDPRIASAMAAWRLAEARISDLQTRLARVEQTITKQTTAASDDDAGPRPPRGPQERRDALVEAGVDVTLADEITWRESRVELDRLSVRDLAVREGWIGTDRYRDELNRIAEDDKSLREEIGDASWDRYLHGTGENNRVAVAAVIPGSAAEAAGLQSGDLIESYAGERLFEFSELREATTQGERDELVSVRVRRNGALVEAWVPRGPLGVRLDSTRAEPQP